MYTLFQIPGVFCLMYTKSATIGYFSGSCWLYIWFSKDIENDLPTLRVKKTRELRHNFCRFVQIYSNLKQLISEFITIHEYKTLGIFLLSLLTECSSLLICVKQLVEYYKILIVAKLHIQLKLIYFSPQRRKETPMSLNSFCHLSFFHMRF